MEITINPKLEIGQKVWALLSVMNAEDVYTRNYTMKLYEKKIVAMRFYKDDAGEESIKYFLEGMSSYEGENWFIEPTGEMPSFLEECIFLNYRDAYKAYLLYKEVDMLCDIREKFDSLTHKWDELTKLK